MGDLSPMCARGGCDNRVPPKGRRGPARVYCSDACRVAALRERRQGQRWLPAVDPEALQVPSSGSTDEQVVRAVAEQKALASIFARLAGEARPELAAPCERMCRSIRAALGENFGEEGQTSPRVRTPVDNDRRVRQGRAAGAGNAVEVAPGKSTTIGAHAPAEFSPVAAGIWDVCIADMALLGHLREPDLILLRGYCETASYMIEAAACVRKYGVMMKEPILAQDPDTGGDVVVGHRLKANPAVKIHGQALNSLRLVSNELGLNPMARVRGNLMDVATSSIAYSIRDRIEAQIDAEDEAVARRQARRATAGKAKSPR